MYKKTNYNNHTVDGVKSRRVKGDVTGRQSGRREGYRKQDALVGELYRKVM